MFTHCPAHVDGVLDSQNVGYRCDSVGGLGNRYVPMVPILRSTRGSRADEHVMGQIGIWEVHIEVVVVTFTRRSATWWETAATTRPHASAWVRLVADIAPSRQEARSVPSTHQNRCPSDQALL